LEIGKELGQGRYGRVCIGKWKTKNIRVALKFCQNRTEMDEFMREMNLMISIPPHRNVVRMFGVSIDGTQPIIVMEYCDGGIHSSSSSQYILSNLKSQTFTHVY
jgi:serine/threonine protein kinase